MANIYSTVKETGYGEVIEKKSRFIAELVHVSSEEEAQAFIARVKKRYYDARHTCFAYVIGEGQELLRAGDDGEPQGTAGRPMLDILLGAGLYNAAVTVTRYFGGTLLGTGGLVKAYSQAVKEALQDCVIAEKVAGVRLEITTDYNGIGKIQYLLGQEEIMVESSDYTDIVKLTALIPNEDVDRIQKLLTEATNGKAALTVLETCFFEKI